tara:strand:- start:2917 stop:3420 length:504 start_codon:yes stop_codon:yes gene_type:complete
MNPNRKLNKVRVKKEINSSVDVLWDLITRPGHLNMIHPFCKSNYTINWPGKESIDVLVYLNNLTYHRKFISWNYNVGYDLLIGKENGEQSYVKWEITSDEKSTFLSIELYPYFFKGIPKIFSAIPFSLFIRPKLIKYLDSVISGINWHLENNKKVPPNFFGSHKWFS